MKHYIAMSGLHGCLPDFCCSTDTFEEAVDTLINVHDLDATQYDDELVVEGYTELPRVQGCAEYAEIVTCDCDDPEQHNDQ